MGSRRGVQTCKYADRAPELCPADRSSCRADPPIARWIPNVAQNRKAVHITGFSKEEVVGQDLVRKFITAVGAADFELAVSRVRVNIR